ncbi:ACP phosphodiesterase [Spirosoma daeguense]
MNILAHSYLSGRDKGLIIGNFIGDFIKGDPVHPRHQLSPSEIRGIRLHRAIDSFTDSHPAVDVVRDLLHPRCHKYAGAAVDVFFDHFLATNFETFSGQKLSSFIKEFYQTIETHQTRLPTAAARMAEYMIRQDWLSSYQFTEGIDRSLKGISRRTAYPSGLDTAIEDFTTYYDLIGKQFSTFWPELVAHTQPFRSELW